MRTVLTAENQTVFDVAMQHYGDVALFDRVLELNPALTNDYSAAQAAGVLFDFAVLDLAHPLAPGQPLAIDPVLTNKAVLRELEGGTLVSFDKNLLP